METEVGKFSRFYTVLGSAIVNGVISEPLIEGQWTVSLQEVATILPYFMGKAL